MADGGWASSVLDSMILRAVGASGRLYKPPGEDSLPVPTLLGPNNL